MVWRENKLCGYQPVISWNRPLSHGIWDLQQIQVGGKSLLLVVQCFPISHIPSCAHVGMSGNSHTQITHRIQQRVESDLFINETARAHNTRVEASPESLMRIAMPKYKRIWCEEKISYAATSRLFHGTARYLMGFETCSRFLFYTAIIATITISILLHQWTIAGIAVLLWSARFTMQLIVFRKTAKVFGERKFCALLPLFDFLQPAWNGVFKLQRKFRRKNEFMRK